MADGDEYLGHISLRHSLDNPFLAEAGGHIGYAVRPGARRRGHASAALRQVVEVAGRRGIERVLVTCDLDNTASARTIESCGGVLEDERSGKRRYWVSTGRPFAR
jgi:predicted acetyltransferase